MGSIKFTIIVAAYNVENYIDECIKSLINQTYNNIEIIVVNDGSTDDTNKKITKYVNNSKITIINQKNSGLSASRNIGLKKATGDYVFFVDGDDYVEFNLLEVCNDKLENFNFDMLFFGYNSLNSKGKILKKGIQKKYKEHESNNINVLNEISNNRLNNYTWSFITKKSVLDKIQSPIFVNEISFEDIASTYKIVAKSNEIYFLENVLYHYVQRKDSITKSPTKKQYTDLVNIKYMIRRDLNELILYDKLDVWFFYIDIACYQILSYEFIENADLLKILRKKILSRNINSKTKVTSIKIILIRINLYKYIYPILARIRWI